MLIIDLCLFNFLFSIFFMIVQLCLVILFFLLYTYKTCLPYLVIKDSFTLEIPIFIFLKAYSPSVTISSDIKFYYPLLFPATVGRRDYSPISSLTSYGKKCIKFLSAFAIDKLLSMSKKCLYLPLFMSWVQCVGWGISRSQIQRKVMEIGVLY